MTNENLVYTGTIETNVNKKMTIAFTNNDFYYDGKNIVITIKDKTGEASATKDYFYTFNAQASGLARRYSGSTEYNMTELSTNGPKGSTSNNINILEITYVIGGTKPSPTFTGSYAYPSNNATGIFNPYLKFYAENKTHYKVLLSTSEDFSANVTYVAGSATTWVESPASVKEVSTANISGLTYSPATKYYWKVIASNGGGAGDPTAEIVYNFTTKEVTTNPGAVTNMLPVNGATDLLNPELTWTYGDNTVDYQVIVDNEVKVDWTNIGYATTGSYQTSGLSSGEHTWRIDAKNSVATTTGTEYSFTVASLPDNVTPNSPAHNATNVTNKAVTFTFADNTSEYRILYNDGSGWTYVVGNATTWETVDNNTETFNMPSFSYGKTYQWAVDVKNTSGNRSKYDGGEEIAIYSFTTASHFAENTAPQNNAIVAEYPTLAWNYHFNPEKQYQYQILTGTNPDNLTAVTESEWLSAEGTGGSYNITANNITNGTKNYWQVNVKDENETEIKGDVWSFDIYLAPQNVQATPEKIFPNNEGYGSTAIQWNMMSNVSGYNVYLNNEIQNNNIISTNYYTINNLSYNMVPGHSIYVEAVYGNDNKQKSNPVNVKVTGLGEFRATVKGYNSDPLENTTITLTCTQDEFEGNANNKVYTFTTDEDGVCSGDIFYGTYNVRVSKDGYNDYTGTITISSNIQQFELDVTLNSNAMYDVIVEDITLDNVTIYLANDELWGEGASGGNFVVYVYNANDELVYEGTTYWFSAQYTKNKYEFNWSNWDVFPNGSYKFRVSNVGSSIANMSDVVVKNFDVFEGTENDRSWYTANNWRSKQVPGDNNANVYVLAPLTILQNENITVETLTILGNAGRKGKIDIYGSLNANNVYNQGGLKLYDGGQLRQNNTNLEGEFVMGIANPTGEWNNSENTTGWQFISSPFTNAPISHFTNNIEGNYDLYKFDGTKADAQWVNQKDENNVEENAFETQFVKGRGYLASYETETTATLSGIMNAEKSTSWSFGTLYNENNHMAKFHLLGNPFTFNMKLSNFIWNNNVVEGVAIVNSNGGYKYSTVAEDEIATIPVGDGFFIKATGDSPSIIYSEGRGSKRGEIAKSINVIATSKAGNDNVVICFSGEKDGFDKLQNFNREIANIYVENNGSRYGIYNCDENTTEVELSFSASQMGTYSISFDINGDFENVVLVDRLTGIETNMLIEDEYTFVATSKDNAKRFFIRLEDNSQEPTTHHQYAA